MLDTSLTPRPLQPGDTVAIVSPASAIDPKLVEGASDTLSQWGFVPKIYPHALGSDGSYSGSARQRYTDMANALSDPSVRAILCSRGGYGAVHLLDRLSNLNLRNDPKWLIGFSDISALHGLMHSQGILSIHGSMARQLALGTDNPLNMDMLAILTGGQPQAITWQAEHFIPGRVTAPMVGGNLAVLAALIDTPYDLIKPRAILVIEDVAEPIYKVERILYQLRLSGRLNQLAGLVVGHFTEYRPDRNHSTVEEMLQPLLASLPYPVATNAPIGHIDDNRPWVEGAETTLTINKDGNSTITQPL